MRKINEQYIETMQLINNKKYKNTIKSKRRGVKFKYHTEIIPYNNLLKIP